MKQSVLACTASLVLALSISGFGADTETNAGESPAFAAEVFRAGDEWQALVGDETVHSGLDMRTAIQAAIDGLTPDRVSKETVLIRDSGVIATDEDSAEGIVKINLPSYTVLDFGDNTIHVRQRGDAKVSAVRAQDAKQIEVRNLRITGNAEYGIFLKGFEDAILSNIHISMAPIYSEERGHSGIRTEGGEEPWSGDWNKNLTLENIFVADSNHHGVELWRTDGVKATTITTRNTGGSGLQLNQTRNASFDLVDAYRACHGGGYAGLRAANGCGPNVRVGKLIAVECGRGIFTLSHTKDVAFEEVDIRRSTGMGIWIENTPDFVLNGGSIVDSNGAGIFISSRWQEEFEPANNILIQNVRIKGSDGAAIYERGDRSHSNRFLNNDLRGNVDCLISNAEGSVAEGNICD